MQYRVSLDVGDIIPATTVGMLLQSYGFKIISAHITPLSCPIQQEAMNGEARPVVAKPSAPTVT